MRPLKFAVLPALLALSVCQTTTATSIASASFQVSFVVNEACTIASVQGVANVQCRYNTPYLIHRQATPQGAGLTIVTF